MGIKVRRSEDEEEEWVWEKHLERVGAILDSEVSLEASGWGQG